MSKQKKLGVKSFKIIVHSCTATFKWYYTAKTINCDVFLLFKLLQRVCMNLGQA